MASLKQIRTATGSTLEANLSGLKAHRTVPGSAAGDIVVIQPADDLADFNVAMGRGTDTYQLDLIVLVPNRDLQLAQDKLDDYITGAGSSSIRQVVFNNRTLGLASTNAHVSGVFGYGADYRLGETPYLGATQRLVVHTKGTE